MHCVYVCINNILTVTIQLHVKCILTKKMYKFIIYNMLDLVWILGLNASYLNLLA